MKITKDHILPPCLSNIQSPLLKTLKNQNFFQLFNSSILTCKENEQGMVAYGGKINISSLLQAYTRGIFPWYSEEPVKWYSPPERMIFELQTFKVSKNLKKAIKNNHYNFSCDSTFTAVINYCQKIKRKNQSGTGTWITNTMLENFILLHHLGLAHSFEVKRKNVLVGGLYGLSLGKAFFGESMFSLEKNTSQLSLYTLYHFLKKNRFHFIDCQVPSEHLKRLGATCIPKKDFLKKLELSNQYQTWVGKWTEKFKKNSIKF